MNSICQNCPRVGFTSSNFVYLGFFRDKVLCLNGNSPHLHYIFWQSLSRQVLKSWSLKESWTYNQPVCTLLTAVPEKSTLPPIKIPAFYISNIGSTLQGHFANIYLKETKFLFPTISSFPFEIGIFLWFEYACGNIQTKAICRNEVFPLGIQYRCCRA